MNVNKTSLVAKLAVAAMVGLLALSSQAWYYDREWFFKIDGIEGEANDSKHSKWIPLLSFSHGSAQSVQTGLPDVSGRGVFEPIIFRHEVDKATPKFQEYCMKGVRIGSGVVHFCRPVAGAQRVVYQIDLEGIKIVSAIVMSEELEDDNYRLVEEVKLLVNKQTWTATPVELDNTIGSPVSASYDQVKKSLTNPNEGETDPEGGEETEEETQET